MKTLMRTVVSALWLTSAAALVAPVATAMEVPAAAPVMAQPLFVLNAAGVKVGAGGGALRAGRTLTIEDQLEPGATPCV
jgi:hypothetical protein